MKRTILAFFAFCIIFSACNDSGRMADAGEETQVIINPELNFRPNVIWLVAEDMSATIPSYGDSTIETPTLSQLAREGVVYDNFYTPHPVCAPARASIITGMYANRIAASHMRTGPWYSDNVPPEVIESYGQNFPEGVPVYEAVPPAETRMFTEYLRNAGYYCTNNSKQDYQFRKTPGSWDESSPQATWKNRKAGQPFFAVFNFNVTHESQIWQKAEDSLWVDNNLEVPVPPYLPDTETGRKDIRRMYSNIREMDAQVGEVLALLEEDGLLDSTIVIWYSDHGGPLPRQKRAVFDSGVKVPMIIRFPGQAYAGARDKRMISFIDLGPTILSLANLAVPGYMDGTAFLGPNIREEEPEYVFGAADRFDEITDRIRFARNSRFKYIRNYMPDRSLYMDVSYRKQMPIMQELLQLKEENALTDTQARWFEPVKPGEELYDVDADPHELNNLADDPAYSSDLQELSAAMDQWLAGFEDTGLIPEVELIQNIWPDGKQPVTEKPELERDENGSVRIVSMTGGATIAYKIYTAETEKDKLSWQLYREPVALEEGQILTAVAHRIGFLRSQEVNLEN